MKDFDNEEFRWWIAETISRQRKEDYDDEFHDDSYLIEPIDALDYIEELNNFELTCFLGKYLIEKADDE